MKLNQLLSYTETFHQQFISGSKEAELDYLKFHFKRFKILDFMIQSRSKGKLLDIGTTPFTFYLSENTNQDIFALDYNKYLKERTEAFNIQFQSGDLGKDSLPYAEDFFDTIVFAEVFEHMHTNPVYLLSKLFKLIKPGGILIFGTPNMASLANRFKLFMNQPILDYPTWDDSVHGHDRIYVKKELVEYLTRSGFKIQDLKYSSCVDFIPSDHDSKVKIRIKYLAKILSFPFRLIFPSLNGTIFIIAQKPDRNDI